MLLAPALGFLIDGVASIGPDIGGKFWPIAAAGILISTYMVLSARPSRIVAEQTPH